MERNLDALLQYVPVMPAPVRALEQPYQLVGSLVLDGAEDGLKPDGCRLVRGTLPAGCAGERVYLLCAGTAYEAFQLAGGGFAAYVPANVTPQRVLYQSGGRLFALAVVS